MAGNLVSRAVTAMVLMAAGLGSLQAAEKIHWEDLQQRLYQLGELRTVNVVTRDGQKHQAIMLTVAADDLTLYDRENVKDVPRQDVARVEIRQRKRYYRHIGDNVSMSAWLPLVALVEFAYGREAGICIWGLLATPPLLAYTIASAPVFLAADGVVYLKPAKTFEVVQ